MDRENRNAAADAADSTKSTLSSGNWEPSSTRSTPDTYGSGDNNFLHNRSETVYHSSNTIKVDEDEEESRSGIDHDDPISKEVNIQGRMSTFNSQEQPIASQYGESANNSQQDSFTTVRDAKATHLPQMALATTTTTSKDVLSSQKPQSQIPNTNKCNSNARVNPQEFSSRPANAFNFTTGFALTKSTQGIGSHTTQSPQGDSSQVTGTSLEPIKDLLHDDASSNDASRKHSTRSNSSSRAGVLESQLPNLELDNPRVSQGTAFPPTSEQTEPEKDLSQGTNLKKGASAAKTTNLSTWQAGSSKTAVQSESSTPEKSDLQQVVAQPSTPKTVHSSGSSSLSSAKSIVTPENLTAQVLTPQVIAPSSRLPDSSGGSSLSSAKSNPTPPESWGALGQGVHKKITRTANQNRKNMNSDTPNPKRLKQVHLSMQDEDSDSDDDDQRLDESPTPRQPVTMNQGESSSMAAARSARHATTSGLRQWTTLGGASGTKQRLASLEVAQRPFHPQDRISLAAPQLIPHLQPVAPAENMNGGSAQGLSFFGNPAVAGGFMQNNGGVFGFGIPLPGDFEFDQQNPIFQFQGVNLNGSNADSRAPRNENEGEAGNLNNLPQAQPVAGAVSYPYADGEGTLGLFRQWEHGLAVATANAPLEEENAQSGEENSQSEGEYQSLNNVVAGVEAALESQRQPAVPAPSPGAGTFGNEICDFEVGISPPEPLSWGFTPFERNVVEDKFAAPANSVENLVSAAAEILNRTRISMQNGKQASVPAEARAKYAIPGVEKLALGQLLLVAEGVASPGPALFESSNIRTNEEDMGCTFCNFSCDYGVRADHVLLPIEAFPGFCDECHRGSSEFYSEWEANYDEDHFSDAAMNKSAHFDAQTEEWKDKHGQKWGDKYNDLNLPTAILYNVPGERNFISESEEITGRKVFGSFEERFSNRGHPSEDAERVMEMSNGLSDVTRHQGIQTCRSSPYGQVDCRKAKICQTHLNTKLAIVNHHYHKDFGLIINLPRTEDEEERRCMICTDMAMYKCDDCPLRLCSSCQTIMTGMCKGVLNNFIYTMKREHIRNDAFLLRSDGGGF